MQLTMRRYGDEGDYWRIREFLRQVFMINERRELSWQAYRFDYWRWHIVENIGLGSLEKDVFLWEAQDGGIAAVLNPEGKGIAYLQVHPQSRSSHEHGRAATSFRGPRGPSPSPPVSAASDPRDDPPRPPAPRVPCPPSVRRRTRTRPR